MNDINQLLLTLLTYVIRGDSLPHNYMSQISDEEIRELYDLSKKHDISHLIGVALENTKAEERPRYKQFFTDSVKSMYRYEWMKGEQKKIYKLLEQYNIPYIPLKGSVIRDLYIEPWHRTSSDIDILIPENCLDDALIAFENELSYTKGEVSHQDVSMTAPNGVHFELHFDSGESYVDCAEFWADAQPASPDSNRYVLSAEMLILTHIAHMAKHFINGGCGLRPFLDLWLMIEKLSCDQRKLSQMLDAHGLTEFGNVMLGLVDVWFNGKTANETECMAETYILPAGVYGDIDNKISVTRAKGKSLFSYAVERIFPPRFSLKIAYPILIEHPWLMPVCWVCRWVRLILAGKLKQVKSEYSINRSLTEDNLNDTVELLERLGLNK